MNGDDKLAMFAIAFFLVGVTLALNYNAWNEETHNEYKEDTPCISWSLYNDNNKCPEDMMICLKYGDWKFYKGKSYWKDLAKRLGMGLAMADECNNFSLYEVGDEYRGYTDTYMPYLSSYMEFCKFFTQTENIRMLVLDDSYRREYTDVNESQIIGRQFNAGRGVSAVYHTEYGAMLKVSRCGCNNEYKYIQPVFVVHHEDYLEFYKILESVYNISTQIKEPPQDIPTVLEVNITPTDAPKITSFLDKMIKGLYRLLGVKI